MEIPVVFAFDNSCALPASIAMASLLDVRAGGADYRFIVLDGGVSPRLKRKFESVAPVRWVAVGKFLFAGWPRSWFRPTCFRLVMAEALPDVSKAIWCDCDVLFRRDPSGLFASLPAGCDFSAVPFERSGERSGIHRHRDSSSPVYSPGFFVADLERWRRRSMAARFREAVLAGGGSMKMFDLDAMNAVDARVCPLPPEWCVLERLLSMGRSAPEYGWYSRAAGEEALDRAVADPALIHYAGPPVKVWLRRLRDMPREYARAAVRSPLWDPDRERGGFRAAAKFLWNAAAFAATLDPFRRRQAGIYRRAAFSP